MILATEEVYFSNSIIYCSQNGLRMASSTETCCLLYPALHVVDDGFWGNISANENTMGMSHVKIRVEECSLSESSVLSSII
jgi:hypothetical protein